MLIQTITKENFFIRNSPNLVIRIALKGAKAHCYSLLCENGMVRQSNRSTHKVMCELVRKSVQEKLVHKIIVRKSSLG